MIKLGCTRKVKPVTFNDTSIARAKFSVGTVVYVHPQKRYCILAFDCIRSGAKIRESFKLNREGEID